MGKDITKEYKTYKTIDKIDGEHIVFGIGNAPKEIKANFKWNKDLRPKKKV